MSKVLVEVWIPAAQRHADALIPYEVPLHDVLTLLRAVLADETEGAFAPGDDSVLCDAETGAIFNVNLTPEEAGLQNGSRVMLV